MAVEETWCLQLRIEATGTVSFRWRCGGRKRGTGKWKRKWKKRGLNEMEGDVKPREIDEYEENEHN